MAAPIAVWAAIGGSAGAADVRNAPVSQGAAPHALAAAHSGVRARAVAARAQGRLTGDCPTTRTRGAAKHRANCRPTSRRTPTRRSTSRAPRPPRTLSTSTKATAGQAGTIAKVLATPCQNTQLIPDSGNLALVRTAVLCLINTERAQNGKQPLGADARLEQAAESHGREMISLNYFDHVSPSGLTPVARIRATGYIPNSEVGYVIGENLAWGTLALATPQAIVNAWIASPEHLANILEGKYRDTAIDVQPEVPERLAEGVAGALYTQEFGVIVH